MVELSDLDENKLDRITAHKQCARKTAPNNIIIACDPSPVNNTTTFISADGEIVAKQLRQIQRRDFNEADIATIIAAYKSGKSTNRIATEYNCHRRTICGILKKHGIEVDQRKIRSEEDVRRVLTLYEGRYTIADIAKQFGVSDNTINQLLHKHGVKIRSRWDYERR